jgi:apolipoprotein D and lipocalin family protein
MNVQGDPGDPTSLQARIRAAEAAVARRDASFLREFDALSGELQDAGRKGLGWVAGGAAVAGVLLLISAMRPGLGRRPQLPARRHHDGGHHATGWFAAALPIAMSLLGSGARHGVRLPGMAGVVWSLAQQLRRARGGPRTEPAGAGLQTVAHLDLQRYAGAWFEYARLPTATESVCASDVTAHYTLNGDGTLRVLNRCVDRAGTVHDVRGVGRAEGHAAGRLEVCFAPKWLRWLPFVWAPYWVLDVDADYRHALVGTPDRRHLWLLARAPQIERDQLLRMVMLAEAQGFPVERLRRTRHRGAPGAAQEASASRGAAAPPPLEQVQQPPLGGP